MKNKIKVDSYWDKLGQTHNCNICLPNWGA